MKSTATPQQIIKNIKSMNWDQWSRSVKNHKTGIAESVIDDTTKNEIALFIGDKVFRLGKTDYEQTLAGYNLYAIVSNKRIVENRGGSSQNQGEAVKSAIALILTNYGIQTSDSTIQNLYSRWKNLTKKLGELNYTGAGLPPVLTTNNELVDKDETQYSLHYSSYKPDKSIKFPLLKETFDRLSEPKALAAWIYGVYSQKYLGRQIPWIYGENGEEGKSYLLNFLGSELFGSNKGMKSISNKEMGKNAGNFTMSQFLGCKLIVYPDCNNTMFLRSEVGKMLSGGGRDSVVVEEKFKAAVTTTIDARMIVLSNKQPAVVNENWYLSRLMYIDISPVKGAKDPNIHKKYKAELNGFLAYAEEAYNELCPDNEEIKLKSSTKDKTLELVTGDDTLEYSLFNELFTVAPSYSLEVKQIKNVLLAQGDLRNSKEIKDFLRFLNNIAKKEGFKREYNSSNNFTGYANLAIKDAIKIRASSEKKIQAINPEVTNDFGDIL